MELATSSHIVTVKVKCEPVVKQEPEWGAAAASGDLYEDHEIKEDLAFSPELLQKQDIARSMETRVYLELERQTEVKEEVNDHRPGGSYDSDISLSNGGVLIKEEKHPFELEPPDEVKREPECVASCSWGVPRSASFEHRFKLRSCFVRLHRIPLGDRLTRNTCPITTTVDRNPTQHAKPYQSLSCKPTQKLMVGIGKSHICTFCDKLFTKKSDFTRHVRIHTGEKPYSCDVCDKRFTDHSRLARHIRIHKREAQYSCDVCHTHFVQKADLNKHLLTHMGEKPHSCNTCHKPFAKQSDLLRHIRVHTGEKPYSCTICDKQFADLSMLSRHKRVHSGVKSYGCNVCPKRFVQKSHLKRHVLIHTGEKPFICDVCDKRVTQKQTLIVHLRMHSGERPYDCNVCHKKFVSKSGLTKHLKAHEGDKPFSFHIGMRQTAGTICPNADNDSSLLKVHKILGL